jgi:hypothetical protein
MTISAIEPGRADEDRLERNLELYRDLSVALRDQITRIKQGGGDAACKDAVEAVKNHQKALQTVLDLEASLVKKHKPWTDGSGGELDLAAARAEILARLAAWAGGR